MGKYPYFFSYVHKCSSLNQLQRIMNNFDCSIFKSDFNYKTVSTQQHSLRDYCSCITHWNILHYSSQILNKYEKKCLLYHLPVRHRQHLCIYQLILAYFIQAAIMQLPFSTLYLPIGLRVSNLFV